MQNQTVDISIGVILKVILALLGLWVLYLVRDVIALLIVSIIFVSAIEPAVDWLQRKRIPRSASVLGIYAIIIALLGIAISFIIPPIIDQFQALSENYPAYSQKVSDLFGGIQSFINSNHITIDTSQLLGNLGNEVSSFSRNIFSTTLGVFSGIISLIVIFSLTFYMSVEEDGIKKFIVSVTPRKHRDYAKSITDRIKRKIGNWLIGQLFLMLSVFILDYIGLTLVGVPYALILAIFAGILEIIPYIGPIISAIPGVVIGFLISPVTGLLALLVYVLAQQVENHILTPQIMKRAVGLNPITVIVVLLIGAKLGGIMGAILAIPVATTLSLFVKDFMENWKGGKEVL
jgi:predicted PurR-regulated permease PerM